MIANSHPPFWSEKKVHRSINFQEVQSGLLIDCNGSYFEIPNSSLKLFYFVRDGNVLWLDAC